MKKIGIRHETDIAIFNDTSSISNPFYFSAMHAWECISGNCRVIFRWSRECSESFWRKTEDFGHDMTDCEVCCCFYCDDGMILSFCGGSAGKLVPVVTQYFVSARLMARQNTWVTMGMVEFIDYWVCDRIFASDKNELTLPTDITPDTSERYATERG